MGLTDLEISRERKRPKLTLFRIYGGNGIQGADDQATNIYKDFEFYQAIKTGDLSGFVSRCDLDDVLCSLSPGGNTFLHVAAKYRRENIAAYIASKKPSMVLIKNLKGETALHIAAKGGDAGMASLLARIHRDLFPENGNNDLLRAENEIGNTALHEALSNGWDSVAQFLIKEDPEVAYYQNKEGESALYLAAKAGLTDSVSLILELSTDQEALNELFKKKSPIKAAIQGKHRGVLAAMFEKNPIFIQQRDEEGRNPLHYAASSGHLEEVCYLLNQCADNVTERDNSGSFPIHLASIEGHVDVLSHLLQGCPYPGELLDRDGCNILHLAAKHGRYNVVSFVLDDPDLEDLINMKDKHGNTPLHLATLHWHTKIVHALTWDTRVDINLVNEKGLSALDVAEHYVWNNPPVIQRLTWAALRSAGTPRFLSDETVDRKGSSMVDKYKDKVSILLVVSTLVATVTFAAGFTLPGGYNNSESDNDSGMATMLRQRAFHVFVFCDTIAMYSSIAVVVALIWAQLGDFILMLDALNLALPLLGIALGTMSMAFTAGLYVVVSNLKWLATAVLIMGITFILALLLFFLPFCSPLTSKNRVLHYLSYYPFRLLMLVIGSS